MKIKNVDKKLQREALFLVAIVLIVCLPLAVIIAFLKLKYNLENEYQVLITFPIVVILGIFSLMHMYKKDVLHPELKKLLKPVLERKKK